MQIKVSYITANEIMEILGIGRSKAYDIVREMNQELENAGIRNMMIEVDQESTAFEQIRTRLQTFKEIL